MKRMLVLVVGALVAITSANAQSDPAKRDARGRPGLVLTLVPFPTVERRTFPRPLLVERAARAVGEVCVGTKEGPEVLGDLVTMRRPGDINLPDPMSLRALAAAYISQNPAMAERFLAPMRAARDPETAFLGILVTAHIQLRAGASRVPEPELDRLSALAPLVTFSTADLDYLRGLNHFSAGQLIQARNAADLALQREPTFFNAHMLRVGVELRYFAQAATTDAACVPALIRLATALRELTDLSPCPIQAAYVDAFLDVEASFPSQDPALLLTRAYLATLGRNGRAVSGLLAKLRTSFGNRRSSEECDALMLREVIGLERLLSRKEIN
jgi:hypothetical protein